jgi:hypothetical protein
MQSAVPVGQGAMAALIGLEFDAALEVAREAAQGRSATPPTTTGRPGGGVGHKPP